MSDEITIRANTSDDVFFLRMAQPILSLLVVLAIAIVAYGASVGLESRIVGGENAEEAEFPYQVSFRVNGRHLCGGTLITDQHVLTAAHCAINYANLASYENLTIISGTNSLARGGDTHTIRNITYHDDYVGGLARSYRYDIAIFTLTKKITVSASQSPISLPIENTPSNVNAVVSGWGRTIYPGNSLPTALQKANMTLLNITTCQGYTTRTIYEDQICALNKYGIGVCNGDSGGPLVYDGYIVGIVSWGRACALEIPDVYTRVYSFLDYINGIINNTET